MSNERRSDKFRARAQETTRIPGKFPQQKYHRILKVRLSKEYTNLDLGLVVREEMH